MNEFPGKSERDDATQYMVPSGDDALFELASSHAPSPEPEPTPDIVPLAPGGAEPRVSEAFRDLGYSTPFVEPDIETARAIVKAGAGSKKMRADVARDDSHTENEIKYGLTGKPEELSDAELAASQARLQESFDREVERLVERIMAEDTTIGFEKAHTQAFAQVKARRERQSRIA